MRGALASPCGTFTDYLLDRNPLDKLGELTYTIDFSAGTQTMASIDVLNAKLKGVQGSMDLGVPGLTPTRDALVAQIQSAALVPLGTGDIQNVRRGGVSGGVLNAVAASGGGGDSTTPGSSGLSAAEEAACPTEQV